MGFGGGGGGVPKGLVHNLLMQFSTLQTTGLLGPVPLATNCCPEALWGAGGGGGGGGVGTLGPVESPPPPLWSKAHTVSTCFSSSYCCALYPLGVLGAAWLCSETCRKNASNALGCACHLHPLQGCE